MSDIHPTGEFTAEVVDHGIATSKAGKPMLVAKFKTIHGYLTGWFSMSEKAIEYTVKKAVAMGFTGKSLSDLNDGKCLIGKECTITVKHEDFDGKTSAKVDRIDPLGGGGGAEIKRDLAAAKSAAMFDGLLHKEQSAAGVKPVAKPSATDHVPTGDEIPF